MNRYTKIFSRLLPALMLVMTACTDDIELPATVDGPEGEDTTINLTIQAPEMSRLESRADMTTSEANSVQSLWVGIYNYTTRRSTLSDDGGNNGLLLQDGQHGFTSGDKNHTRYPLTGINTKSGRSYIVAVANPDLNYGYKMGTDGSLGPKTLLSELLAQANTWDEFLSIVIERELFQNAAVLGVPNSTPLPMSGIYVDDANLTHPDDWTKVEPYQIPLMKKKEEEDSKGLTLDGSIHLRRPFTQVKFNVSVEPNDQNEDIVSFDVESYRVYNVPTYGWLYERSQGDNLINRIGYANAGDAMQPVVADNNNYVPSLSFVAPQPDAGVCSFDFWLMENKRSGRADFCTDYQKREIEWKNGETGANTGVYQSLCPTADPTLNNLATYVEIHGTLTYRKNGGYVTDNPTEDDINIPGNVIDRTAEVTYTVHLGYAVGNNEGEKARDFNNYRNSIYTYNVKVKSANSIIVEAFREGDEPQPGAEGVVTDVTNNLFECDAHPEMFNIHLTSEEIANFSFTMRSYYDNQEHEIYMRKKDENGNQENNIPARGDSEFKFYDWIELVPTTDANTIAPFPNLEEKRGWQNMSASERGFYYLGDLSTSEFTEDQYFTVYVNEHAYVPRYGDANWGNEKGNNWHAYVNTVKPRQAWLNVGQQASPDGNSSYYQAKYSISQQPIQTYYDLDNNTVATALGLEHVNESFGMNIRWTKQIAGLSADNGRYNVWLGLGNSDAVRWNSVVNLNKLQEVNEITNSKANNQMQYAQNYFNTAEKTWNVPMQNLITSGLNGTQGLYNGIASDNDPQVSGDNIQYIEALQACMNRNRDENGNGVIDKEELKWYLPASGKYARMILGRRTLSTPLMNYLQPQLTFSCALGQNTIYHFMASDNKIVWADEGMSSSYFYGGTDSYSYAPWQVRCIRNLGTDLTTVSDGEKVTPAYNDKDRDETTGGGVVKVTTYYGGALRTPTTTHLPMHKSNSINNALGQYGFEIAVAGNDTKNDYTEQRITYTTYDTYSNAVNNPTTAGNPCAELNNNGKRKGWRVPNQSEIVIMLRMGLIKNAYSFMTCTQEYYSNSTPAIGSDTPGSNYRILTITDGNDPGKRTATAREMQYIYFVRCVRDLTSEEAKLTYEQILAR